MAGRDGARGYAYQALVAVLKCFECDSWNEIKVEPLTHNDKVDILLKKNDVLTKAIQVKTSINKFEKPDIQRWINEIKKDIKAKEYELVLVGESLTKPAKEFIINNNDKNSNVYIEIIRDGEAGIEKLAKNYLSEFLKCYNPNCSASFDQIDNIVNNIFAKLMKMSANDDWFSKIDLINIINKIITKKEKADVIKRIVLALICIAVLCVSIYISKESFISTLCVFASDIIITIMWGILKYSDIYFWKHFKNENEWYDSREYNSECKNIAVGINKDDMLCKQKVYIENISDKRIISIEGKIVFFCDDLEKNKISFNVIDLDRGRKKIVDEIAYNTVNHYVDKTHWDEAELNIEKMIFEDGMEWSWSGRIVKFVKIYNFDQFNYLTLGEVRILPYEITWLKNKIALKLWGYIQALLTVKFNGYDRTNLYKHIRIRINSFFSRLICRIKGWGVICLIVAIILVVLYGQLSWMIKLIYKICVL